MRTLENRLKRVEDVLSPAHRDVVLRVTYVAPPDENGDVWARDACDIGVGWKREINGPRYRLEAES